MSATETMVAPLAPPILSQEVIDVDALEDDGSDGIVWSGFRRPTNQASPRRVADRLAEDGLAFMGFRASSTSSNTGRRSHTSGGAQAGPSSRAISDDVIILESEDEGGPSSSSNHSTRPNRTRRRLVSPPPPRTERGNTPAVPVLPPHLASQSSLPRRRQRPGDQVPNLPPSIRPRADPLPFETRIASLPRLPPRNTSQELGAAPRSHHQPAMGFGGAILALNRQSALEEANRRERDARSNAFNLPSFTEMFRRMTNGLADSGAPEGAAAGASSGRTRWQRLWPWAFEDPDADIARNLSLSPGVSDDDMLFDLPLPHVGDPYRLTLEKPTHWKPDYTHPDKAVPGFTHDFAPAEGDQSSVSGSASPVIVLDEDEAGPSNAGSSSASASTVETTLVCARCLDPLVLAAPNGSSEDERKKCRVWALRCGHMLDGKCIAELYAPPPPAPVLEEPVTDVKGKGKARAHSEAPPAESLVDSQPDAPAASFTDGKGKRKAVEPVGPLESESPPSKRARFAEPAESEGNSIRSRLRSHARLAAVPNTAAPEAASAATDAQPSPPRRGRRSAPSGSGLGSGTGRGKGKGKGKARAVKKPAVEAEHEWKCPVPGCGRVHFGVRMQGEWKNDEGRGAIALFV